MDTIEARREQLFDAEYLCIFVNDERLDKILARLFGDGYLYLIPAWFDIFAGYPEDQMDYIWSRSRIDDGEKVLPLLLCPDDFDFGCTTIVAEVIPAAGTVTWNRLGADTTGFPAYVGETVDWFSGIGPFVFDRRQYADCIKAFLLYQPKKDDAPPKKKAPAGWFQKAIASLAKHFSPEKPVPAVAERVPNRQRQILAEGLMNVVRQRSFAVGGLFSMGLDESERYLLAASHSGRGVFDLVTGERVARDDDEKSAYAGKEVEGIGPLAGSAIPMYGLFGHDVPDELWTAGRLLDNEVTELKSVLRQRDGTLLVGYSDGVTVFTPRGRFFAGTNPADEG